MVHGDGAWAPSGWVRGGVRGRGRFDASPQWDRRGCISSCGGARGGGSPPAAERDARRVEVLRALGPNSRRYVEFGLVLRDFAMGTLVGQWRNRQLLREVKRRPPSPWVCPRRTRPFLLRPQHHRGCSEPVGRTLPRQRGTAGGLDSQRRGDGLHLLHQLLLLPFRGRVPPGVSVRTPVGAHAPRTGRRAGPGSGPRREPLPDASTGPGS